MLAALPPALALVQANTLVIGTSGSGRSLLLARLAEAAHAVPGFVAFVETGPGSVGHRLTARLGGTSRFLDHLPPVGFNPFWVPADVPGTWQPLHLTGGIPALAGLLRNVFSTGFATAPCPAGGPAVLADLLRRYFQMWTTPDEDWQLLAGSTRTGDATQQWNEGPGFNSFYEYLVLQSGFPCYQDPAQDEGASIQWLLTQAHPYYAGGEFDYLLNGLPTDQAALVAAPGRCLWVQLSWLLPSPLRAFTCWLLLYTLDTHHGQDAGSRLTVVTNELPGECLAGQGEEYFLRYAAADPAAPRHLLMGWQGLPPVLAHNPLLLHCFSYRILFARAEWSARNSLLLAGLSEGQLATVRQLRTPAREVAFYAVSGHQLSRHSTLLSPEEVAHFHEPPEIS